MGQRLERLRKECGLTQVEVAQHLDVAQPTISQFERDERRLHSNQIVKLAKLYKVSADQILGLEKAPPSKDPTQRKIARRLNRIVGLSRRDQQALFRTIDAFLTKAG